MYSIAPLSPLDRVADPPTKTCRYEPRLPLHTCMRTSTCVDVDADVDQAAGLLITLLCIQDHFMSAVYNVRTQVSIQGVCAYACACMLGTVTTVPVEHVGKDSLLHVHFKLSFSSPIRGGLLDFDDFGRKGDGLRLTRILVWYRLPFFPFLCFPLESYRRNKKEERRNLRPSPLPLLLPRLNHPQHGLATVLRVNLLITH